MTDPNPPSQPDRPEGWQPCAPGTLTGYSRRIHRRQLLILSAQTAGAVSCIAAIGLGGWMEYLRRMEVGHQYYGMTCSDVRELLPAYLDGRLDTTRSEVLEKHVRKCSTCAGLRAQLRGKSV
jgi:hypothetical protein